MRPTCQIAAGKCSVALPAHHGVGGRNQELALAASEALDGSEAKMLIAFATDGEDGPTEAAGAVVTGATVERARALGMTNGDYLGRHRLSWLF